jgi:hypothetical protein
MALSRLTFKYWPLFKPRFLRNSTTALSFSVAGSASRSELAISFNCLLKASSASMAALPISVVVALFAYKSSGLI